MYRALLTMPLLLPLPSMALLATAVQQPVVPMGALPLAKTTSVLFNTTDPGLVSAAGHGPMTCVGGGVLVQAPWGLLGFGTASFGKCEDCSVNGIVQRTSTDGGRTWGPYTWAVTDKPTRANASDTRPGMDIGGNPSAIWDPHRKRLLLQFVRGIRHTTNNMADGGWQTCNPALSTWQQFTSDGKTWSKPVEISHFLGRWAGSLLGFGNGILLQRHPRYRGRTVFCGHWGVYNSTQVWYTDDGGDSYKLSATVFDRMDESTLSELSDGRCAPPAPLLPALALLLTRCACCRAGCT